MREIEIKTFAGNHINSVVEEAKVIAIENIAVVVFDFNGILCKVSTGTNAINLIRDYGNAHLMGWKTIGPICLEYSESLKEDMRIKIEDSAKKAKLERVAYNKKIAEEKRDFQKLIDGVEFKTIDKARYADWKTNNADGYGAVIFEYAENWGKMLQLKLGTKPLKELVEDFNLQPNYLNISGFQHGASTQILKKCWLFGKDM